jgi:hypothetical protein
MSTSGHQRHGGIAAASIIITITSVIGQHDHGTRPWHFHADPVSESLMFITSHLAGKLDRRSQLQVAEQRDLAATDAPVRGSAGILEIFAK